MCAQIGLIVFLFSHIMYIRNRIRTHTFFQKDIKKRQKSIMELDQLVDIYINSKAYILAQYVDGCLTECESVWVSRRFFGSPLIDLLLQSGHTIK